MPNEKATASAAHKDDGLDYSARPFGYIAPESKTAMLCEPDPVSRDKISSTVKKIGFEVVQPATFKDALKYMKFHTFDVILVNEKFNTDISADNIMNYLESLNMSVRRKIFVVLISETCATMDNMQAYNKSVNMIINISEIGDIENILKQTLAEHNDFYYPLMENIRKYGIS